MKLISLYLSEILKFIRECESQILCIIQIGASKSLYKREITITEMEIKAMNMVSIIFWQKSRSKSSIGVFNLKKKIHKIMLTV